MGDGRAKPRGREADLQQSVDRPSGESARLAAPKSRPTLSQRHIGSCNRVIVNNGG